MDYRGECNVILTNLGKLPFKVNYGDRIGQFVLKSVYQIDWIKVASRDNLEKTARGSGGFGSTGV